MYEILPLRFLCQRIIQWRFGGKTLDALVTWKLIPSDLDPKQDLTKTSYKYKITEKEVPVYKEVKDLPYSRMKGSEGRYVKAKPELLGYKLSPLLLYYENCGY